MSERRKAHWRGLGVSLVLVALCAGCGSHARRSATAPPAVVPAAAVAGPDYFDPGQIDALAIIEPPPEPGSDAARGDLRLVLEAQQAAHAAGTTARAVGDAEQSCARVAEALGDDAAAVTRAIGAGSAGGADAVAFATQAALQAAGATGAPKRYWKRPRPYLISTEVERLADVAPDRPLGEAAAHSRDYTSYPSGHAAFGAACAIVLAQMVPERRAALFARGLLYGQARLIVGAHFATDVAAGRIVGAAAAGVMLRNARFQADLQRARAALRAALGLPAQPRDLEPRPLAALPEAARYAAAA